MQFKGLLQKSGASVYLSCTWIWQSVCVYKLEYSYLQTSTHLCESDCSQCESDCNWSETRCLPPRCAAALWSKVFAQRLTVLAASCHENLESVTKWKNPENKSNNWINSIFSEVTVLSFSFSFWFNTQLLMNSEYVFARHMQHYILVHNI